jgi:serine/threonine-protein kinase
MFALTQIPGYDFIHTLGRSKHSLVIRARDQKSGEDVAIKMAARNDGLKREAAAGLAVRHPHLVHIRAAQLAESPCYVVMDFLSGISLQSIFQQQFTIELNAALRVTRQIAEALAALHRAGFNHGDVKPENVQWVDSGNVVLIDLGLARRGQIIAEDNDDILGTPDYLAPECCTGNSKATDRSDIFSLGVMLFEMLTGELPYTPGKVHEVLKAHREQIPVDLRDYPGDWPRQLVRLLHRMLAFRPCDRPAASVLVQELIELEIATNCDCPRTAVRGL